MTTKRFSKIFTADVTFNNTAKNGTAKNGNAYKSSKDATITRADGSQSTRTVMGFGDQLNGIKLRKGSTVSLAIQADGGVMKIVGLPKVAEAA